MKYFYITTPIYYVNDKPHLGTLYTTVLADVLKNYHQMLDFKCFMLTGTDEHGQKCSQSADKNNIPIQIHCDKMTEQFKQTWKLMNISYDLFSRTTAPAHKQVVQKCLQKLYDKKLIYVADYEGWYSVSEEIFYAKKDLVDGKSPTGKEVTRIKEKNYFFKMSAYQEKLIQYIQQNPDFIQPISRRNEVLGFLKQPLDDLCISRPKTRLSWGVEIPFDTNYVTYVWVDALLNYTSGVGLYQEKQKKDFQKWWQEAGALHLIGKDILITHSIYWPCLLMALDLSLPRKILAHGWLLNQSSEKMSKSHGDVMDPVDLLKTYDADSLRYFLVREAPIGKDAPVSYDLIRRRINEDLANNLGNLLRRSTKMIYQHFDSYVPNRTALANDPLTKKIKNMEKETVKAVEKHILDLQPALALEKIVQLLDESNRYLEQKEPWKLIKTDKETAGAVLSNILETIYLCAFLLKPVMPIKMEKILNSLNCSEEWSSLTEDFHTQEKVKVGEKIQELPPLFPRIQ